MGLPVNSFINSLRTAVKADKSIIIAFLSIGNPEPQYKGTRHNAGHLMVQRLIELFGGLSTQGGSSSVSYGRSVACENLYFAQSKEYMNTSAKAARDLQRRVPNAQIVLVHDDMELAPGDVKFKLATATFGGHNGLKDIGKIGAFPRMRVGVGEPPAMDSKSVSRYVLSKTPIVQATQIEEMGVPQAYEMVENMVKVYDKKFKGVYAKDN